MTIDQRIAAADRIVQAVIDGRYAESMARMKLAFEHDRRALSQRTRLDHFRKHVPKDLKPEEAGARIRHKS